MYSREIEDNIYRTIGDKINLIEGIHYLPTNGQLWSQRPHYEYVLAVFNCIDRITLLTGKSFDEVCKIARQSNYYLNVIEDHVEKYRSFPVDDILCDNDQ